MLRRPPFAIVLAYLYILVEIVDKFGSNLYMLVLAFCNVIHLECCEANHKLLIMNRQIKYQFRILYIPKKFIPTT